MLFLAGSWKGKFILQATKRIVTSGPASDKSPVLLVNMLRTLAWIVAGERRRHDHFNRSVTADSWRADISKSLRARVGPLRKPMSPFRASVLSDVAGQCPV